MSGRWKGKGVPGWMAACSLIAFVLGVSGCGSDDDNGGSTASGSDGYLAVVQARGGTLTKKGDSLELILNGVAPQVLAFTERPQRKAATVGSSTFFDTWTKEYGGDPPNAALALLNGKPDADTVILTLDQPSADGSSVRFRAHPVGSAPSHLGQFEKQVDPMVPTGFRDASLFVDAGGLMQLVAYGAQDVYATG